MCLAYTNNLQESSLIPRFIEKEVVMLQQFFLKSETNLHLYLNLNRVFFYSALSLESTSSASSTSCLNSNSLESEPSPKIKKIDVDEDNKRKEDGVDASHNISSKNTDSSKNIVYDELFYANDIIIMFCLQPRKRIFGFLIYFCLFLTSFMPYLPAIFFC